MLKEYKIEHFKEIDSTNIYTKNRAKNGEAQGLCVIADKQIGGYGRMGRSFYSPDSSGLYMSILLRPHICAEDALLITTAAAVSVSDAIDKITGCNSYIKWVNDIYMNDKKVCGILCESSVGQNPPFLDYCVLGIGVNLTDPKNGFPNDLKAIAGSVFGSICRKEQKDALTEEILKNFKTHYKDLTKREFYKTYREKCFIIGKRVNVIKNGHSFEHTVCDIDEKFRLITKNDSNEYFLLDSGEVSLKWNI